LYARAAAARTQSQALLAQLRTTRQALAETVEVTHAALDRTQQIRDLWHGGGSLLQYSAYARLQARLASMPVIEQAKGIIMAQSGWPEEKAFDVLRRASQRENTKVRDLAARVVAQTVNSTTSQQEPPPHSSPAGRRSGPRNQGLRRRKSA
jgi:hypothetical protein